METSFIRQFTERLYRDPMSSRSRKFTSLLVGQVDSRVRRGALPCIARTSWHSVTMERTSPSAHSTGRLLPPAQLSENGNTCTEKRCRAELSDTVPLIPRSSTASSGGHRTRRDRARVWAVRLNVSLHVRLSA